MEGRGFKPSEKEGGDKTQGPDCPTGGGVKLVAFGTQLLCQPHIYK